LTGRASVTVGADDDGAAERAVTGPVLGRKNYLFAGSDAGGERGAVIYSLVETCKLNAIDPFAYLQAVLASLPTHPAIRLDELLPYNWKRDKHLDDVA
jgi:transposase